MRDNGDTWFITIRAVMVAIILFTAFFFLLSGCANKKAEEKTAIDQIVLPVTAVKVTRGRIENFLTYTGSIDAVTRVVIAPAVPGRIEKILVDEGRFVSAGQVLVRMDDKQLIQVKASYETAEKTYARIKALHERGSATVQQLEQAGAAFEAAKAGYEQMLSSVELRAPFSGTIIGKYYNDGEIYSTMKPGPEGLGAILSLAKLNKMKIEVKVPELDYARISTGIPAFISVDALATRNFTGKVSKVSPALDMRSRTATITIEIDNDQKTIRPGMFARVRIVTEYKDSVLIVPTKALVTRNDSTFVFKVKTGTVPYETRPIPLSVHQGLTNAEFSEVSSEGLDVSDLVLMENNVSLTAETAIKVTAIADGERN